ncbi:MAG: flagellar biosynthesis protein FlhF [Deltaproteobacteria bacterium]|nr:flagellar biosynthesis protein FlhF [Deltaproteobacteria bacterium]
MQVRVFEAPDMRSAIEKVKKALGPDALILSTRDRKAKNLGSGGKGGIEVVAAVDADLPVAHADAQKTDFQGMGAPYQTTAYAGFRGHPEYNSLVEEFREMRRTFENWSKKVSRLDNRMELGFQNPASYGNTGALAGLSSLGLQEEVIRMFAGSTAQREMGFSTDGGRSLKHILTDGITRHVRIRNPLSPEVCGQRRLAFVGPTGVGKTTTIAKVAACALLNHGKTIVLATIDHYRIAAVEQLKIYGQIMDIAVESVRSPEQLADVFKRHSDKDLILVDTAGGSPKDDTRLRELGAYLDPVLQTENHLVLSANTGQRELDAAVERFSFLDPAGLVFTKLDECDVLGRILNAAVRASRPLSLLTNGQRVPEDLLFPQPEPMAEMILNPEEVTKRWNVKDTPTRPEPCVN